MLTKKEHKKQTSPEVNESKVAKKRSYHKYNDDVVDVCCKFGGIRKPAPGSRIVEHVKKQYPSPFPTSFNESRVKSWEQGANKKSEGADGTGKDWEKGACILPAKVSVWIGTAIKGQ